MIRQIAPTLQMTASADERTRREGAGRKVEREKGGAGTGTGASLGMSRV